MSAKKYFYSGLRAKIIREWACLIKSQLYTVIAESADKNNIFNGKYGKVGILGRFF